MVKSNPPQVEEFTMVGSQALPSAADPGYCYLHMISEGPARERALTFLKFNPVGFQIASWLIHNMGAIHPGRFMVTLGLPRISTNDPNGFPQAHVIQAGADGLRVMEILRSFSHCRFGAAGEVSNLDNTVVTVAPERTVTFLCKELHVGKGTPTIWNIALHDAAAFSNIASGWPVVSIKDLHVTVHPTNGAAKYFAEVQYGWRSNSDAVPSSATDILKLPGAAVQTLASAIPGGYWPQFSFICPLGTNGISHIMKAPGTPDLKPVLTLLLSSSPIAGQDPKEQEVIARLFMTFTIVIGV